MYMYMKICHLCTVLFVCVHTHTCKVFIAKNGNCLGKKFDVLN